MILLLYTFETAHYVQYGHWLPTVQTPTFYSLSYHFSVFFFGLPDVENRRANQGVCGVSCQLVFENSSKDKQKNRPDQEIHYHEMKASIIMAARYMIVSLILNTITISRHCL